MTNHKVLIITGATASGKSGLALEMAQRCGGVIINADSMQLYADAPIITAQPTAEDQVLVEHRLYGVIDGAQSCSVAQWLTFAVVEIRACWQQGVLPILVGGTGMYLKALMDGLSSMPDIADDIRVQVRDMDATALAAALSSEDPLMAKTLHQSDTQRMARALEVIRGTGKSLAVWQQEPVQSPLPEAGYQLVITDMPREQLYQRINQRYDGMIEQGALEEALALHQRALLRTLPLCRAVGVAELLAYHDGVFALGDAITKAKTNSRRYAKRQLTWMRHQFSDIDAMALQRVDISGGVESAVRQLEV